MDWIRVDTSLIFEKKYSYLRVTNFIPKTFIIINPKLTTQIGIKKRILVGFESGIMNFLRYPLHHFFNW